MRYLLSFFVLFYLTSWTQAFGNNQSDICIVDLKGSWRFMIGDDKRWSAYAFDDSGWEQIRVPSSWENQGFPGYDGYAWYRKEVTISGDYQQQMLELALGYIDDVDEVFFNGVKIGRKGSFPPNYWTAYNAERKYNIPAELIKYSKKNTIAVRVYDSQLNGGIVHGQVGIYVKYQELVCDVNLEGFWKFNLGDNKNWALPSYNDTDWQGILVPGIWEDQVASNYDGFGWYRKQFMTDPSFAGKRYVLMLGKIDDLDEVYLNGKLVGKTGLINNISYKNQRHDEYRRERFYYLDEGAVIPGKVNTIAVRVWDGGGEGGIYSGPVGLVELKGFVNFWRNKK